MSSPLIERVRVRLLGRPTQTFRAAQLARELREKDVRLVKGALEKLRSAGDVVSCRVITGGLEEEEFRISAGGPPSSYRPPLVGAAERPMRKPDGTPYGAVVRRQTRGETLPQPSSSPVAPAPQAARSPSSENETGEGAAAAAGAPRSRRGPRSKPRREGIARFIEAVDRPVFPRELLAHFREKEPTLKSNVVYMAMRTMKEAGELVFCGKAIDEGHHEKAFMPTYATTAIAERFLTSQSVKNNGGETARPPPGIGAEVEEEATRPGVEKAASKRARVRAVPSFGFLSDGTFIVRGIGRTVTLEPPVARALLAWIDSKAGTTIAGLFFS